MDTIILFLIAEKLKNLGKYTFADVTTTRLKQSKIRILSACGTLVTVLFYLIAQMVGAGALIPDFIWFAIFVCYLDSRCSNDSLRKLWWNDCDYMGSNNKALLLIIGASILAFYVLKNYSFSLNELLSEATKKHQSEELILYPGKLISDPISAISLGVALIFGTAGLPHILMRFFTVPDAKSAKRGFLHFMLLLLLVIFTF